MNSPVTHVFLHHINLDKNLSAAVYIQLAQGIIHCIQRGYLNIGDKLPGTRVIAEHLGINRNTVVKAMDELHAQAWLEIKPNQGTYVLKQFYKPTAESYNNAYKRNQEYPKIAMFDFRRSILLEDNETQNHTQYHFNDGIPDIRLNHFKELSSHYTASMNRKTTIKTLMKDARAGNLYFKKHLSNYLNQTRGLRIGSQNLLINRTKETSIYLLSRVLINLDDIVAVAEWSNSLINMSFQQAGAKIITIPIDEDGIQIEKLEKLLQQHKIRLLYITPHQHYPTTATLSAYRRLALLELANTYQFIILEDDFDYDFHYEKTAILPIASADSNGWVIYTGTFAKSLTSSFQKSFIIAPDNLIHELEKYQGILDKQGDPIMDIALADMIDDGVIHRYLKRSNQVYKARRDFICHELKRQFGNKIKFKKPNGGLAIWVEFTSNIPLSKVAEKTKKQNLSIPKNILFQNKNITAMRIGFGHMNEDEIKETLTILRNTIEQISI